MQPVLLCQTEAHEIHRDKGLDVRLSLAVAMSIMQMILKNNEIDNVIEEVVDLARQISLEVDSGDVQELPDSND
ncbi:hypothetical protein TNCV_665421 [Trichonephila clavipes]|uniref:Uncharacterized protein n=1 Tax=Trichonephila clavipes TaxID=2585209 RepID=A0A8X6SIS7_TRICX|nr:hypothetical protein TNCV_665421 [Trichonephila clavipes]